MKITRRSEFTGNIHTLDLNVTDEQMRIWNNGETSRLIQQIFPQLTASEREFILTGVTAEEWDEALGDEE